jgi:hypothetical protein
MRKSLLTFQGIIGSVVPEYIDETPKAMEAGSR